MDIRIIVGQAETATIKTESRHYLKLLIMKKVFFAVSFLFITAMTFASSTNQVSMSDTFITSTEIEDIHLTIKVEGTKAEMIKELKSIQSSLDNAKFDCSVEVTVTWNNGEQVSASFSSKDNCKTAMQAAINWLNSLL